MFYVTYLFNRVHSICKHPTTHGLSTKQSPEKKRFEGWTPSQHRQMFNRSINQSKK